MHINIDIKSHETPTVYNCTVRVIIGSWKLWYNTLYTYFIWMVTMFTFWTHLSWKEKVLEMEHDMRSGKVFLFLYGPNWSPRSLPYSLLLGLGV